MFLAALVGVVAAVTGVADLYRLTMLFIAWLAPTPVQDVVREWVFQVVYRQSPHLLSVGALLSLVGSSAGLSTLTKGLDRAHRTPRSRPFWPGLFLAVTMTVGMVGMMLLGLTLYGAGQWIGIHTAGDPAMAEVVLQRWESLRGLGQFAGLVVMLTIVYTVLPTVPVRVSHAVCGAGFAAVAWFAVTRGFGVYLEHLGRFDDTYGGLSVAIVLLVWMFAVSVILLLGGEITATLCAGSPDRDSR
jgi:membrane protein